MDRAFIEGNQILERYLAGSLPYNQSQAFEQFCRDNPGALDERKFGDRLAAGLRLMEISGRPRDWQEPREVWWKHWQFPAALGVVCLGLLIWLLVMNGKRMDAETQIATLKQQLVEGRMQPPSELRTFRVIPGRGDPANATQLNLPGPATPLLATVHIDVGYARQDHFRLMIERKDQTRIGNLYNLRRDSNGELRVAINTSLLRPGQYRIAIEGLPFRSNPVPVGWIAVQVGQ